ncbi:MAG: hypothetical protein CVU91_12900 [Firmicutes bacterium HGW-Firmicutes-16]|nr:MAG: hypothetical protein CVU91_12900 [Firmicutes bacterium HGW-Firmicutes-16]
MSENELILKSAGLPESLTEEDERIIQTKLWQLLARHTELYTMGDSSSVRIELAQELLQSISFCLDLFLKQSGNTKKFFVEADLEELLRLGQTVCEEKIELGKKLYSMACRTAPEIDNISFRDTLKGIGGFFKHYDFRFFAHQIPCDIDYQLCNPVKESLQGIEYINDYLGRIIIENDFVRRFEINRTESLLNSYCSDYKGLLINLYAPLAANAVGLALLGEDVSKLNITASEGERLAKFFEPLSLTPAKKALNEAALRVCSELKINDASSLRYLRKTAEELYPRIEAALPHGKLSGIFISFDEMPSHT